MHDTLFYCAGSSPACQYAVQALTEAGLSSTAEPGPDVTHLLLDIPSFQCGAVLERILPELPEAVTVIGGRLPVAGLHSKIDLLEDAFYLSENAAITAECALHIAFHEFPCTLRNANILIIGWGRIGKQLSRLLAMLGANVSVCSRSVAHQAEIAALGFSLIAPACELQELSRFRILFNTAPSVVIPQASFSDALKIELASKPGFTGTDVVQANGLPGRFAPESSGKLIARTILRKLREDSV